MASTEVLARFERVNRAAIRAFGRAFTGYVQINLGMAVPDFHVGLGAGAIHTALRIEVNGKQLDIKRFTHAQTLASQDAYFGLRPLTMSKNAA